MSPRHLSLSSSFVSRRIHGVQELAWLPKLDGSFEAKYDTSRSFPPRTIDCSWDLRWSLVEPIIRSSLRRPLRVLDAATDG